MKRFSIFVLAASLMSAFCFTSCEKDETESEEATLSDFCGTYDVTITENTLLSVLNDGEQHSATMTIEAASASLYGMELYSSSTIGRFTFTTSDEDLEAKDYWSSLNNTYGYVKDGYLMLVVADSVMTQTIYYRDKMPYKQSSASEWVGFFGEKPESLVELVTGGVCKLNFSAIRRD